MVKTKIRKSAIAIFAVLFALCVSISLMGFASTIKTSAYDKLPSEFGTVVGEKVEGTTYDYFNYTRGYVKMNKGTAPTANCDNALSHISGINVSAATISADGETTADNVFFNKIAVATMVGGVDFAFDMKNQSVRKVFGAGLTQAKANEISEKFKAKYTALYNEGFNPGVPMSKISDWDLTVIKMDFRYGSSTANADSGTGGKKNNCHLVYSVTMDEVYLVANEAVNKFDGEHRRIGAPIMDMTENLTLSGTDGENKTIENKTYKAQVCETGILVSTGNDCTKHEGAVLKVSDTTYEIHQFVNDQDVRRAKSDGGFEGIGNLDGTWHPLKTANLVKNSDGSFSMYVNYVPGCVKMEYNADKTQKSAMRYFGYNFVKNGSEFDMTILGSAEMTDKDDYLWEGLEGNALDFYKKTNPDADAAAIKKAFKDAYIETVDTQNFIPGYRCSPIKMWDLLVLDYKYGSSDQGFDTIGSGGRERMTTMVFSPVKNKVYPVRSGYWGIFKLDGSAGRNALGAPISYELKNHTFGDKVLEEVQFFEQGYIYKSGNAYKAIFGITAKGENYNEVSIVPAPGNEKSRYGAETARTKSTDGRTTYINYEMGAVKAVQNEFDNGCYYTYYPGRTIDFNDSFKVKMLSAEAILGENGSKLTCSLNDNSPIKIRFNESLRKLIFDTYKAYMADGYFLGFPEGSFSDWDSNICQQFIFGDSTATPFDGRPYVAVLFYNKLSKDVGVEGEEEDKLFLLDNDALQVWSTTWIDNTKQQENLGAPTSNEYTVKGFEEYKFQDFAYGFTVKKGSMNIAAIYDGTTVEQYLEDVKNLSFPDYEGNEIGREDVEKEIPGKKGCGTIVMSSSNGGIAGGGLAILVGVTALSILLIIRKKKKTEEKN